MLYLAWCVHGWQAATGRLVATPWVLARAARLAHGGVAPAWGVHGGLESDAPHVSW